MTSIEELDKIYVGHALDVKFECFASDGTTVINLTGGKAELRLSRGGLRPFNLLVDTDADPTKIVWTNQAQGKGTFKLPASDLELIPVGIIRMRLRSIEASGKIELQSLSWLMAASA